MTLPHHTSTREGEVQLVVHRSFPLAFPAFSQTACRAPSQRWCLFSSKNYREAKYEGGGVMVTEQAKQMAEFHASIAARTSKPDLDLATMRDITEGLHVCGTEPEGVTYAEVDAGGVPALWCIPQGSDTEHVLLHSHNGGTALRSLLAAPPPGRPLATAT